MRRWGRPRWRGARHAFAELAGTPRREARRALRARPDDQAAYLVFSDFLQGAGELIAVQVALAKKKNPALGKREKALLKSLDLLDADLGALTFRWGLLDSVKLENSRDWMEQFDVRPVLEKLFGSPALRGAAEVEDARRAGNFFSKTGVARLEKAYRAPTRATRGRRGKTTPTTATCRSASEPPCSSRSLSIEATLHFARGPTEMNNRLTLAALSLAVAVLSFNCGMPMTTKTDAGSGGGIGATGGGAGATGGGTATGGGSARVCDPAPPFVQADSFGVGYDPGGTLDGGNLADYNYAGLGRPSDAGTGRFDVSINEFYAAAPVTTRAIPATTYALCDACFYINTNCDNMGTNCAKSYLAQSGTYAITTATKNAAAGTFTFTLTDVVYEAWDFRQGQDRATDAGCFSLPSLTFTGTWP